MPPDPTRLDDDGPALRARLIATARGINAAGINVNQSGNVSVRCARDAERGFLITPTALPYDALVPDDIVFVRLADGGWHGLRAPSSEWRFHFEILRARADLSAIVHTHSPCATALACHGLGIPPFHYMVAVAGGADIRCAPYATFGTQALADHALAALSGRKACLLAHHGVIAADTSLDRALALAIEIEHLARIYLQARTLGEPPQLPPDEMARVLERFVHYRGAGTPRDG